MPNAILQPATGVVLTNAAATATAVIDNSTPNLEGFLLFFCFLFLVLVVAVTVSFTSLQKLQINNGVNPAQEKN